MAGFWWWGVWREVGGTAKDRRAKFFALANGVMRGDRPAIRPPAPPSLAFGVG